MFGKTVDKILIAVSSVALVGVVLALVVFTIRRLGNRMGYTEAPTSSSGKKKGSGLKRFEDYWDEESEDHSSDSAGGSLSQKDAKWSASAVSNPVLASITRGSKAAGDNSVAAKYWEQDKTDSSVHSTHPLNIALPKRI